MIFFPFNLLLRRGRSIQGGNGTGWASGLVVCLSNTCLINGVTVGGITELSAFADNDEVPASPFSPSGILTIGSSSLAVDFLGFTPLELEPPTFSGERTNVWEGEWRCKNQRSNPRWTPKSPEKKLWV